MVKKKVFILVVVAVCAFVVGSAIGGLAYYYLEEGDVSDTVNEDVVEEIDETVDTEQNLDVETWALYENNEEGYSFKYPQDWFILTEYLNPPPPATIMAASVDQEAVLSGEMYASFFVYVRDFEGQSLEEFEEVQSLISDGYVESETEISGQEAIQLERRAQPLDTGAWIYTICGDKLFRVTWGGTSVDVYENNEEVLDLMLDSFSFMAGCT